MDPYEKLLKVGKSQLVKTTETKERFDIPTAAGHVQGSKTIVSNFAAICSTLRRPPEQLLKYLQRELATPAIIDGTRLELGRKITSESINKKIAQYCHDFVICKECGKPDTQLIREDRVWFMKCTACGARQPVRAKI